VAGLENKFMLFRQIHKALLEMGKLVAVIWDFCGNYFSSSANPKFFQKPVEFNRLASYARCGTKIAIL
jgi:hypothetical protein